MTVFAILIGASGLYICVMNYASICVSVRNRKRGVDRYVSPVPFAAGILMFASAVILLPKNVRALGFLAFLLDHTYPLMVYSAIVTRFFTRDPNEKK